MSSSNSTSRQSRLRRLASAALFYELGVQGNTFFENGEYDQAMKCYSEVLRKAGEVNQRHVAARALLNIGNVFFRKGDTSKSFQAFTVALRLAQSLLPLSSERCRSSTSSVVTSGSSISSVPSYLSDPTTSVYLSLVADALQNISAIQMDQGLFHEALAKNSEALMLRRQCLDYFTAMESRSVEGADNSREDTDDDVIDRVLLEVAEVLNNIGLCSERVGGYSDALAAYGESMQIRSSILGPMHLLVAESHLNLGGCYAEIANYTTAMDHYNKSLSIRISELGKYHAEVSDNLNLIAILYLRQDKLNDALSACAQAIDAAKNSVQVEPLKVANAVNTMGMILEKLGFLDSALHNYTESLKVKSKILGGKASSVASTLHNIGNIYFYNDDYDSAMMAYMEGLDIMEEQQLDHLESVRTLNNIGVTYSDLKKYDDAVTFHARALKALKETCRRVDKMLLAETHNYLGLALKGKGKQEEANDNFSLALDIYRSCEGGVHDTAANPQNTPRGGVSFTNSDSPIVLVTSDDEVTI